MKNLEEKLNIIERITPNINNYKITYNQNTKKYIISISIRNERKKTIELKNYFNSIEEANEFVDLLTYAYFIATYTQNKVTFTNHTSDINRSLGICINNEKLDPSKILTLYKEILRNLNESLNNTIKKFQAALTERKLIIDNINYLEEIIDDRTETIKKINTSTEKKEIKTLLNSIASIPYHTKYNKHQININKIANYLKMENASTEGIDLNNEIKNILSAIENINSDIEVNMENIEIKDSFVIIKLISIFEQITEKINEFNKNAKEYEEKKKIEKSTLEKTFEAARNSDIKTAINILNSLNIEKTNIKKINIEPIYPILPNWNYSTNALETITSHNSELFKKIQKLQLEKLTPEEKEALIIYKSWLYRPINNILEILRTNEITLEEALNNEAILKKITETIKFLTYEHNRLHPDSSNNEETFSEKIFKKNNNFRDYRIVQEETLQCISLLESSLKKIETPEEIVVYRAIKQKNDDVINKHFISTSIDPKILNVFLDNNQRNAPNSTNTIIKIIIPKGSNIIAYTDDLFYEYRTEGKIFNEEQKEILLDPQNFDFELLEYDTTLGYDAKIISYIAHPKSTKINSKNK